MQQCPVQTLHMYVCKLTFTPDCDLCRNVFCTVRSGQWKYYYCTCFLDNCHCHAL